VLRQPLRNTRAATGRRTRSLRTIMTGSPKVGATRTSPPAPRKREWCALESTTGLDALQTRPTKKPPALLQLRRVQGRAAFLQTTGARVPCVFRTMDPTCDILKRRLFPRHEATRFPGKTRKSRRRASGFAEHMAWSGRATRAENVVRADRSTCTDWMTWGRSLSVTAKDRLGGIFLK
jgi:hypothetical protein